MQPLPCLNRRFDRSAAGGYLEVRPFDFHRHGPAATIRFLTPGPNIVVIAITPASRSQQLPAMFLIAGNPHDEHDGTPEPEC